MTTNNPHFYFKVKVFSLGLLFIFSQSLFSEELELKVSENLFFEIVGPDIQSTQFMNGLSLHVGESILEEFFQKDYHPPRKILVQLLSRDSLMLESADYDLDISNLGFFTLSVNWDESLSLPTMIEALVVSFLHSYGYANYGKLFLEKYPSQAWLLKGLANHIYLSLRPNVSRLYYEQAITEGFEPSCFNAKLLDENCPSETQSLGLFRFIKNNSMSDKDRLRVFKQALLGGDVHQSVKRSLKLDSETLLSDHLANFLDSQLNQNLAQFESLASSGDWLAMVGDFSSIEISSNQKKPNSLHLLWLNREDPMLVQLIEARIRLISLALYRINPLYYNATQSLALTYQKILDGVEEWELLYYFSDYLSELDQANSLALQINQQLESP